MMKKVISILCATIIGGQLCLGGVTANAAQIDNTNISMSQNDADVCPIITNVTDDSYPCHRYPDKVEEHINITCKFKSISRAEGVVLSLKGHVIGTAKDQYENIDSSKYTYRFMGTNLGVENWQVNYHATTDKDKLLSTKYDSFKITLSVQEKQISNDSKAFDFSENTKYIPHFYSATNRSSYGRDYVLNDLDVKFFVNEEVDPTINSFTLLGHLKDSDKYEEIPCTLTKVSSYQGQNTVYQLSHYSFAAHEDFFNTKYDGFKVCTNNDENLSTGFISLVAAQ